MSVNLVHAVSRVPVIDLDTVAVGETTQFFAVSVVNIRQNLNYSDLEVATFTGDFIDGHGVLLL